MIQRTPTRRGRRFNLRIATALVLAALVIAFVARNTDRTQVSFIFRSADVALWVALGSAAVGGFLVGFLLGRRRYRYH